MSKRLLILVPFLAVLLLAAFWTPPVDQSVYDSARWIDSGLEAERAGNLAAAETDLLAAAKVDHLFQPAWSLAGFYFRRQDYPKFWLWARQALAVGQRDLGALFDLCWQASGDANEIWTRVMPDRKATWQEYLLYLTTAGHWPAAAYTASRIATVAERADTVALINYCDIALAHGDRRDGLTVWQALGKRGLLPFDATGPLTNPDFRAAPTGRCFDWRTPVNSGVRLAFPYRRADITLTNFGSEHAVLLLQPLALDPAKSYRLEFELKTGDTTGATGIHWEAGPNRSNGFAAPDWSRRDFVFPGTAAELALVYQRLSGYSKVEGTVSLRHLAVLEQ